MASASAAIHCMDHCLITNNFKCNIHHAFCVFMQPDKNREHKHINYNIVLLQ